MADTHGRARAALGAAIAEWRSFSPPPKPKKPRRRAAFIVIKSAEGRRSNMRQNISAEELERQRDALARAGIGRIEPALGRDSFRPSAGHQPWGP